MRLGESGLREWLNEPDLYADDRPNPVMLSSSDSPSPISRGRGVRAASVSGDAYRAWLKGKW